MARPLSWSDVRGGIIASVAIVATVFVTLTFLRVGALHGDTFPLYALVGEARGLLVGSEVWLNGQKIGKVVSIDFRSPAIADTLARLEVRMEVLEKYRSAIHRDAVAQIRPGGSFIGQPVVFLTPGTMAAPPLRASDTVNAHPQPDVEGAATQFGSAAKEFPVIINNIKVLSAQLQSTQGTIGAFLNTTGRPGTAEMKRTRFELDRLGTRLHGEGVVGQFMQGDLTRRVKAVMARADSLKQLLGSSTTSFGRLRRDSTLLAEVADIRNELSIIRSTIDKGQGTAGRVLRDSAVTNALADAEREMSRLFADIKKHPFRYILF